MSRLIQQRGRLARVRRIQHNLAATAAARAAGEVAKLEASAVRLAALRDGLAAGEGECIGSTLASLGELAGRLDQAREGLGRTLNGARTIAAQRETQRLVARREQESAERLEQRALTTADRLADRRAQGRFRLRGRPQAGEPA